MAVPKRKKTSSSVRQRRMHIYIKPAALTTCPKCGKPVRPHTICQHCGHYKGRELIDVLSKLTKKEKKIKEREMKQVEKEQKTVAGEGGGNPLTMENLSKK